MQDAYAMEHLCADMIALLDFLGLAHAIFFGHDWGGNLVWNLALQYPQRVSHVCAVCTPFMPHPAKDPWPKMQKAPGRFNYQVWFQGDAAEKELAGDVKRTVRAVFRRCDDAIQPFDTEAAALPPTKRGGLFVQLPSDVPPSPLLSEAEEAHYVRQFERSGYFGALSWYRHISRNWNGCRRWLARKWCSTA
eukprot:TRINITY_DN21977_c0_g1_i3.p1 TRINITY_DN21977_c0_g1~~TRINITY_DN21977_c0_g1_i3.p1  ORF type:complete len:191 (+),score=28.89 TRINITY_DN21977_c0_g1_i3:475-1047(+)